MSNDLKDRPDELDDGTPEWVTNIDDDFLENDYNSPSADDDDLPEGHPSQSKKKSSPSELKNAEEKGDKKNKDTDTEDEQSKLSSDDETIGDGLKSEKESVPRKITAYVVGHKKQAAVGGGILGAFVVAALSFFFSLMPLKVVHVANNLQLNYFGSTESAVSRRIEYHFNRYLVDHVLTSMSDTELCKNSRNIDRTCVKSRIGTGKAGTLYSAWRDAKLESKMFDKYGFEITKRPDGVYIFSVDGKTAELRNTDIEGFKRNPQNGLFQAEGGRNDIRMAVRQSLESETRWKNVMYRFRVGGLMERKYGIQRCIFYCKDRDNFNDWKDNKKNAFKAIVARRVLEPRTEMLGLAMGCLFSTECDSTASTTEGNDENDFQKRDALEKNIGKYLNTRGIAYEADDVAKITSTLTGISEAGSLSEYAIKTIVTKVANETIAKGVGKAIPIIGWVDMVAQFTVKVQSAGGKYQKWAYAVNSAAMVAQYSAYLTNADEIKGGKADATIIGGVSQSLDGMGKSPLYQDIMGSNNSSSISGLFIPSAFAEGTSDSGGYVCDDGNPVPAGKKICNEESLNFDNFFTDASDLFKTPGLEQFGAVAKSWVDYPSKFLNAAGNYAGTLISGLPLFNAISDKIAELTQPLLEQASKIIPNPFSDNMSGGRNFNVAAGGANVAGNMSAEYGIGGKKLSNLEAANIKANRINEANQLFSEKPMYARLFDKKDSKSLVSQIALSTPSKAGAYTQDNMASLVSNPIAKIMKNFGSFFTAKSAYAAVAEDDPFGVPQYGYPDDDPALTAEVPADCDAYNKAWAEDTSIDEASGQEIHNRVNLCLLDQTAIGSAGGYYTSDVLTPEDLGQTEATPSVAGNAGLYMLGDSLTVGMKSGQIDKKLQDKGWTPTTNGLQSRRISGGSAQPDGITQISSDSAIASGAGTIVIALGTNHFSESESAFRGELQKMYDKVKGLNPNATLWWVNLAGSGTYAAPLQQKNAILTGFAQQNNIKIIDWAAQAPQYLPTSDVHPTNYPAMADIVVAALGQAPAVAAPVGGVTAPGGTGNIDTSAQQCSVGTDAGIGITPAPNVKIRLCKVGSITVNVLIERNVKAILDGGALSGITFGGGGYRDPASQIAVRRSNCGTSNYDIYEKPARSCSPPTARPGSSRHEWGLAVDLTSRGSTLTRGSDGFRWMAANTQVHGLTNLPSEPWHWSDSGR